MKKVSVKLAAKLIGASEQYIRIGLQRGRLPFGTAVCNKRWSYNISPKLLADYIGNDTWLKEIEEKGV